MTAMRLHRYPSPSGGIALGKMGVGATLMKRLHYDAEVEYLESTGTQLIDTGFVPTSYTKSEMVAQFTSPSDQQICGAYWDSYNMKNAFDVCGIYNGNWFLRALTSGSPTASGWAVDTNRHTFVSNAQTHTLSVDEVSVARSALSIGVPTEVSLFARHESINGITTYTYPCRMKIFSLKLWDGIVLVRDFIPVRVTNEQGQREGAMYDRLGVGGMNPDGSARNDGLYRNRGTGAFLYGNDI